MKPEVFMICMTDNPISMYYRGRVEESWTRQGFKINILEAVTPKTLDSYVTLKWRYFDDIRKDYSFVRGRPRNLTEGEKSIWHSHRKLWRYAAANQPIIVIEHDAYLVKELTIDENCDVMSIGHKRIDGIKCSFPATAYYITPQGAQVFLNESQSLSEERGIGLAVDSFMISVMNNNSKMKYDHVYVQQLEDLGSTNDYHWLAKEVFPDEK